MPRGESATYTLDGRVEFDTGASRVAVSDTSGSGRAGQSAWSSWKPTR